MKFLNNWDLSRNQLLNAVIQNLATAPANPVKGLIYFNTTDNTYYGWNGTAWIDLGNQGIGTHALNSANHTGDLAYSQIDDIVNTSGAGSATKIPRSDHAHTGADGTDKISYNNLNNIPESFAPANHAASHKGDGDDAIATATTSVAGLMSATDKTKLDGIASGAEVNQNAFSTIAVTGQDSITADSKTDTLTLKAGTGISITLNDETDEVEIASHQHLNKTLLDSYTQSEENLANAVAKAHSQNTDTGTNSTTFQIGTSGPKIKNDSGEVQLRNAADDDYADLRVKNLHVEGTTTVINSNDVHIGDNIITLNSDITDNANNSDGGIEVKRLQADDITEGNAAIKFNESTDKWQVTEGAPDGLHTFDIAKKVTAVIGNGTETDYVITHNLNSRDVTVAIRETNSPYAQVITDVEFTTVNTLTVKFAEAPTENQYTVTIVG